jgi:glutamate racemase
MTSSSAGVDRPIGVFDSGVGGLTVLRELADALPREELLYLGDTARLPYGTKSAATVSRYAIQASRVLVDRGVKLLVVACNTASALALDDLVEAFPTIDVIGVVRPGAGAACRASQSGRIVVLATEATASHGAYEREIRRIRPDANVTSKACSLFVSLAEEGWTDGGIARAVAAEYLRPVLDPGPAPDCLVLGCTHFPVLTAAIRSVTGDGIAIVDSAATTANAVARLLDERGLRRTHPSTERPRFLATDSTDRFARVASRFLPAALSPSQIELVDL